MKGCIGSNGHSIFSFLALVFDIRMSQINILVSWIQFACLVNKDHLGSHCRIFMLCSSFTFLSANFTFYVFSQCSIMTKIKQYMTTRSCHGVIKTHRGSTRVAESYAHTWCSDAAAGCWSACIGRLPKWSHFHGARGCLKNTFFQTTSLKDATATYKCRPQVWTILTAFLNLWDHAASEIPSCAN